MDTYIFIDTDRCTGCGECVSTCPQNAIALHNNLAVIDQQKCDQCAACLPVCPQSAILEVSSSDDLQKDIVEIDQRSLQKQNSAITSQTRKDNWLELSARFLEKVAIPIVSFFLDKQQPSNQGKIINKESDINVGSQKRMRKRTHGRHKDQ